MRVIFVSPGEESKWLYAVKWTLNVNNEMRQEFYVECFMQLQAVPIFGHVFNPIFMFYALNERIMENSWRIVNLRDNIYCI